MWETEWAAPPTGGPTLVGSASRLVRADVEIAYALLWLEHCIECAIPECYSTCPLYVRRADKKCARLRYGIYPNPAFQGLFDFGADVHFRRWGKLESKLTYGSGTPDRIRTLEARDMRTVAILNPVAASLVTLNPERRLNGAYRLFRDAAIARATRQPARAEFDEFVVEVYNPQPEPVGLIVEIHQDRLRFRDVLRLAPGHSIHRLPFATMDIDLGRAEGRILVYPENDAEVRLIFTWLDFVRLTDVARAVRAAGATRAPAASEPKAARPASKVKCVAWDLDNTMWKGILVEDGPEALQVNPAAVEVVRRLDARGILNTIASKNDHAPAWAKLTELGIQDYFVSPAINWGRKSANLRQIAEDLNFNVDTFAFVDDSAFERSEVASELPQVRVFADTDISTLLERPEFDVPVSEESKQRRFSYLAEDKRKEIAASYGDNYDAFLESCGMRTLLFRPEEPQQRERSLELIQRSNQLNLSTRRYTAEEFGALLDDPRVLSLAWSCRDRHGDYGSVGFLSVSLHGEPPVLRDLVISCRIAKKKVENALFGWIAEELRAKGHDRLHAWYKRTARNHVLLEALQEVGFQPVGERDSVTVLELRFDREVPGRRIVAIEAPGVSVPDRPAVSVEKAAG